MGRPPKIDPAELPPFQRRVRALIGSETQAEFARRAKISQSGLNRILQGGDPTLDVLIAIANAGGVSVQYLATGDDAPPPQDDVVAIPTFNLRASAGAGRAAIRGDADVVYLPRQVLTRLGVRAENARVERAFGSSMEPTISDGDLMLIDMSQRAATDNQIFFFSLGDDVYVKRFRNIPGQGWMIVSDNPEIPAVPLPKAEPMRIYGRVRWTERKL